MSPLVASLFLLGLASGVHCVGMCGGFVAALAGRRVIPLRAIEAPRWRRLALFNAGRITSYAAAGALAGTVGAACTAVLGAQTALYVVVNVLLIAIGLHLAGATRLLSPLEALGAPLWRRLQPYASRAMAGGPYVAGLFWGWLPCGLVYGAHAALADGRRARVRLGAEANRALGERRAAPRLWRLRPGAGRERRCAALPIGASQRAPA
jgi:sulfite exporter TauE/SafE